MVVAAAEAEAVVVSSPDTHCDTAQAVKIDVAHDRFEIQEEQVVMIDEKLEEQIRTSD